MGVFMARSFRAAISNTANVYLAIARADPWSNDANPPQANSSVDAVYEVWRNVISGKKVTGGDISYVIRRQNWTANTVYVPYDCERSTLYGSTNLPYVLTDDFNVYKCIFNNKNANSSIKPISTNPNTTYTTADGYIWKYMYTLSDVDRIRFTTNEWIPVRTLVANDGSLQWRVQQAATDGSIDSIDITSQGSGYTGTPTVSITGDGAGASATLTTNTVSGAVTNVTIVSKGSGYTFANAAISGTGAGAALSISIGPKGGHGSDAVSELGAKTLLINVRLRADEGGTIPTTNDFRQIALIADPLSYAGNAFSGTTFSQTTKLSVTGSGANFAQDEFAFQGTTFDTATFVGEIIEFDTANGIVKLAETRGTPTAAPLVGAVTAASRYVTGVTNPDLTRNSGKIIYIDDISPVARNPSQTEDIKLIISFF
jgi:hypothetical protein